MYIIPAKHLRKGDRIFRPLTGQWHHVKAVVPHPRSPERLVVHLTDGTKMHTLGTSYVEKEDGTKEY